MPQPPLTEFEPVGFAFNKEVLDLLSTMGHRGYVNSDSGILSKMAWGVTELSVPERAGKAVMAGTDIIADTNDVGSIREAYLRGLFSSERLDEAARRLTEEMSPSGCSTILTSTQSRLMRWWPMTGSPRLPGPPTSSLWC